MSNGNIRYILKNFTRRHRVSITDDNNREVWYTFTKPHRTILYMLGFIFVIFAASLLVAAFTTVLDIVPGYDGIDSRRQMVENIIRLDSLERELNYMRVYTDNVAQIMEGRGPVVRSHTPADQERISTEKELVAPSSLDSLLRNQMEKSDRYGLNTKSERTKPSNEEMVCPVDATVVERFAPALGRYGVRLSVADIQQVCAVGSGTVVLCVYETYGYTLQIQHSSNFLSTYRGLGQAHKRVGERVEAGQAIGATWNEETHSGNSTEIEIEFWFDGKAVDPEHYITF